LPYHAVCIARPGNPEVTATPGGVEELSIDIDQRPCRMRIAQLCIRQCASLLSDALEA
jgi:hypothetical protein